MWNEAGGGKTPWPKTSEAMMRGTTQRLSSNTRVRSISATRATRPLMIPAQMAARQSTTCRKRADVPNIT